MEHHGKNSQNNTIAIIPARFASTRLSGKLLRDIAGEPMIVHTARRAAAAKLISRTIVATDDSRIFTAVTNSGFEAAMTSPDHRAGSDRVAEVAEGLTEAAIIVNVQGDEPLIDPNTIDLAVGEMHANDRCDIVTISEQIMSNEELLDPNVVKVVCNEDGYALYFSRSPIPFPRNAMLKHGGWVTAFAADSNIAGIFRKHTGLYVYRREYLLRFAKVKSTQLEQLEMLEQLRALESGARIKVVKALAVSIGVDTHKDLEKVRRLVAGEIAT